MNWIDLITNVTGLAVAVINLGVARAQRRPGGGGRQRHRKPPAAPPPGDPAER